MVVYMRLIGPEFGESVFQQWWGGHSPQLVLRMACQGRDEVDVQRE